MFNEYVAMNKNARQQKSTLVLESTCLNRLRVKYNITCHDYKAQSNLERSNKRKRKLGQEEIQDTKNDEELMTVDYEYCGGDSSDDEDDNNAAMATLSCK